MTLIHHVVRGAGAPPVVFVHGFACAHTDWAAQTAHLAPRHRTVAVDLRGHGASPGTPDECSIERYGADVAEVMRALDLPSAVLVGHSMGCRVITEAALQAPSHVAGLVLLDGSQFAAEMEATLKARFAVAGGFDALMESFFRDMFTAKSDPALAASVIERAGRLPRGIGEKLLLDLTRYDVGRFETSLASLRVPVLAVQSTYSNEKRERVALRAGESSPFLEMVRARVPALWVEIIPDTGHFPQMDEAERTSEVIAKFVETIPG